mmetsp:Transcript_32664/g.59145  ORF Transcript_32664/g.59145 Transcript_32664/m.59145 type:complete len:230 (+) Transcript_32664:588-1277(+)
MIYFSNVYFQLLAQSQSSSVLIGEGSSPSSKQFPNRGDSCFFPIGRVVGVLDNPGVCCLVSWNLTRARRASRRSCCASEARSRVLRAKKSSAAFTELALPDLGVSFICSEDSLAFTVIVSMASTAKESRFESLHSEGRIGELQFSARPATMLDLLWTSRVRQATRRMQIPVDSRSGAFPLSNWLTSILDFLSTCVTIDFCTRLRYSDRSAIADTLPLATASRALSSAFE